MGSHSEEPVTALPPVAASVRPSARVRVRVHPRRPARVRIPTPRPRTTCRPGRTTDADAPAPDRAGHRGARAVRAAAQQASLRPGPPDRSARAAAAASHAAAAPPGSRRRRRGPRAAAPAAAPTAPPQRSPPRHARRSDARSRAPMPLAARCPRAIESPLARRAARRSRRPPRRRRPGACPPRRSALRPRRRPPRRRPRVRAARPVPPRPVPGRPAGADAARAPRRIVPADRPAEDVPGARRPTPHGDGRARRSRKPTRAAARLGVLGVLAGITVVIPVSQGLVPSSVAFGSDALADSTLPSTVSALAGSSAVGPAARVADVDRRRPRRRGAWPPRAAPRSAPRLPGCDGSMRAAGQNGLLKPPTCAPCGTTTRSCAPTPPSRSPSSTRRSPRGSAATCASAPATARSPQQRAVKAQKGGLAAAPGKSNHGWGLAVDLCQDQTSGAKWALDQRERPDLRLGEPRLGAARRQRPARALALGVRQGRPGRRRVLRRLTAVDSASRPPARSEERETPGDRVALARRQVAPGRSPVRNASAMQVIGSAATPRRAICATVSPVHTCHAWSRASAHIATVRPSGQPSRIQDSPSASRTDVDPRVVEVEPAQARAVAQVEVARDARSVPVGSSRSSTVTCRAASTCSVQSSTCPSPGDSHGWNPMPYGAVVVPRFVTSARTCRPAAVSV